MIAKGIKTKEGITTFDEDEWSRLIAHHLSQGGWIREDFLLSHVNEPQFFPESNTVIAISS
jgi:hypothetical protein